MLSLENKNTKVNSSNKIRSLNQNFKARLKDKLGFTLNPDRAPNLGLVERFNFGLLPRFNLSLVARFNFGLPT